MSHYHRFLFLSFLTEAKLPNIKTISKADHGPSNSNE